MTVTKKNRKGLTFGIGSAVRIHGSKLCTIVSIHSNGSRVKVTGEYTGYASIDAVGTVAG